YLNLILGLFNLIPAFPMDGGRILRGVLASRFGFFAATRVAAGLGKVFAVLFAIYGFLSANLLLMVVAFFVYLGADAESRNVLVKAVLGHIRVRDLVVSRPPPVEPDTSVFEVGERMLRERRTAFPVLGDKILGIVSLEDVQRVPSAERGHTRVAEVIRELTPLEADEEASTALRALLDAKARALPVKDNGQLLGVLSQVDVARGLQLSELEATQHPPAVRRFGRWPFGTEQHA
ncbi:MAG TPA: CBS domain-containing protein, partial [Anaeromyxobacter sp.]|nr:CBS domain-containing protein [Anaeromyxobacter sp.]